MRNVLFALFLGLCASGCSTSQYGNYSDAPPAYGKAMAVDTVAHLVRLYPPALTRWNIEQQTEDSYGVELVTALRMRGYSVSEYSVDNNSMSRASESSAMVATHPGTELRYIVDSLAPAVALYRVTVLLGDKQISRAYSPQPSGIVKAAGSWARKE